MRYSIVGLLALLTACSNSGAVSYPDAGHEADAGDGDGDVYIYVDAGADGGYPEVDATAPDTGGRSANDLQCCTYVVCNGACGDGLIPVNDGHPGEFTCVPDAGQCDTDAGM